MKSTKNATRASRDLLLYVNVNIEEHELFECLYHSMYHFLVNSVSVIIGDVELNETE